jgi:glycerol-3-phosphate cytidylyltransferase-like family protein
MVFDPSIKEKNYFDLKEFIILNKIDYIVLDKDFYLQNPYYLKEKFQKLIDEKYLLSVFKSSNGNINVYKLKI